MTRFMTLALFALCTACLDEEAPTTTERGLPMPHAEDIVLDDDTPATDEPTPPQRDPDKRPDDRSDTSLDEPFDRGDCAPLTDEEPSDAAFQDDDGC